MCNHVYTADYSSRPEGMGRRCPYPDLFAGIAGRGGASGTPEEPPEALPIDRDGACIFHSADAGWKRENDFAGRFLRLVRLLDTCGQERYYDFAEFVFVGTEAETGKDGAPAYRLVIADTTFRKQAQFIAARFLDAVELERVDFPSGAEFDGAAFGGELEVRDARLNGAGFGEVRFARTRFIGVDFQSYALFSRSRFTGRAGGGYAVEFRDVRFRKLTDFTAAAFELADDSTVAFEDVRFEDFTDFRGARFKCHAVFSHVTFADITDFIDTSFELVGSTARYVGAAVELIGIRVPATGVLTFRSSDPARKLFAHDVEMTFAEQPEGTVRFENADLSRFLPASRAVVLELARLGRVEIGPGCIKYRVQSELRMVPVGPGDAPLVVELCQTFAHYFTVHHGLNLGFEIVARDAAQISFFYFTDEDVTEAEFLARLAQTERSLWSLLSIGSAEQLAALADPGGAGAPADESTVINAVDGLSALMGTFFRVGVRIAAGRWKAGDTRALLGAIRFNEAGAELRAALLHRTLADRYTGAILADLNRRQNALLPGIAAGEPEVRILFLAANSLSSPLDLEKELERIETNLRLAKERERLGLEQVWAATVDRLMRAMLEKAPTIVHFAGHGTKDGIVLRDEAGMPHVVSGEALARLFALFRDSVRCVVLSSCYSEVQAHAIRRHVPHVIGMRASIRDRSAVAFATGFYMAVAAGKDVPFAFELGAARVQAEGLGGEDLLVLL